MRQHLDMMADILKRGRKTDNDRTGVGTRSQFGNMMRFNLKDGFPICTTKFVPFRFIAEEQQWMFEGCTNAEWLQERNIHIWDEWALKESDVHKVSNIDWGECMFSGIDRVDLEDSDWEAAKAGIEEASGKSINDFLIHRVGELGPVYGHQIRNFHKVDQLKNIFEQCRDYPLSRALIISHWNPTYLPDPALTPEENIMNGKAALAYCHTMYQFNNTELSLEERWDLFLCEDRFSVGRNVWLKQRGTKDERSKLYYLDEYKVPEYRMDILVYQRSADMVLGVPFNISFYALVLHKFAYLLNYDIGDLVWCGGNCHIYKNQMGDNLDEWLSRVPNRLPRLRIDTKNREVKYPWEFRTSDFELVGYNHQGKLNFPVAK